MVSRRFNFSSNDLLLQQVAGKDAGESYSFTAALQLPLEFGRLFERLVKAYLVSTASWTLVVVQHV